MLQGERFHWGCGLVKNDTNFEYKNGLPSNGVSSNKICHIGKLERVQDLGLVSL